MTISLVAGYHHTCIGELPAPGDCEAGELREVLGDVAHGHVRHLGVAEAQLPQQLQSGLLVEEPGPRVPGRGEQLVERRVGQVRHIAQVQLLEIRGLMCH